jgi:DNA-directed RNA polymerase subunit RPC12/RpoP
MTEDEPTPCPYCRADLQPMVVANKESDGLSWHKYQMRCSECGYRGFTWEEVE